MNRSIGPKARPLPLVLALVVLLSLGTTAALAGQLPVVIPTFQSPPPGPPNDYFASPTVVPSLPFSDVLDITYATTEANEPQNCNSSPQTVWYSFTPTQAMWVSVTGSGLSDTNLVIYQAYGPGITDLSFVGCSSWDNASVEFLANFGTTYYFQAGKIYAGSGTLQINVQQVPPPDNDNFASAKKIAGLPFDESTDNRGASIESNEPIPSCINPLYRTIWYAYTPDTDGSRSIWTEGFGGAVVAVYTGPDLAGLSQVACRVYWDWGPLTFQGRAGTVYFIQIGTYWDTGGSGNVRLDLPPLPVAMFGFTPWDSSTFDMIQFWDASIDPACVGIETRAWDFGDGATSSEPSPTHKYARDGDYTVTLTVTTTDGRTASTTQVVKVRTHDVAIVKLVAPNAARVGQTRPIVVSIKNTRYPERVHIRLDKSVPGGYQTVADTDQNIPVRSGNRTTSVSLSYTFTGDDAAMGKVTFKAISYLLDGPRDALPADNEAISAPTKVSK